MMRLGRIRCRSLSRPNNLGTVLQVSRQAMGEGEGRDGCRTKRMDLEKLFLFRLYVSLLIFALFGKYDDGIYKDWPIQIQSELQLVET